MTAVAALGEVADINPRETQKPALDETVSFVPMAALNSETAATEPGTERSFAEVQKGYTIFRDRDVLVAKITPCFENNKIGQARLSRPLGVGSTEFHVVRPKPEVLDVRYVLHFLRQQRVLLDGERRMTGSGGQRRVPTQFLKDLAIPMPPLDEQRRIGAILDKADALRAKRRQALAHLGDLTQAIFTAMFGNVKGDCALGELLADALVFRDGDWVESKDQDPEGSVRLTQLADIGDGYWLDKSSRFLTDSTAADLRCTFLEKDDVLVARMPDPLGRACLFPGATQKCVTVVDVAILRPNRERIDPVWLSASINSVRVRRQISSFATGTTRSRISRGNLSKVRLPFVPLGEQHAFSRRVASVNQAAAQARVAIEKSEELFGSLQARAFTGRL